MADYYEDLAPATADGSGNALFRFLPAPPGRVVTASIVVPGAPAAAVFDTNIGAVAGRSWGSWTGDAPGPPIQFRPGLAPLVSASGLTPGAGYQAELTGVAYLLGSDFIPWITPSQPYSTSVSVSGDLDNVADELMAPFVLATPGVLYTMFATPTLAVGLWVFTWWGSFLGNALGYAEGNIVAGTAAATILGGTASDYVGSGALPLFLSTAARIRITSPGDLLIQVETSATGGGEFRDTSPGFGFPGATGYVGYKIAA